MLWVKAVFIEFLRKILEKNNIKNILSLYQLTSEYGISYFATFTYF